MNVGARQRGDSSPTDSGVDTSEWEENRRGLYNLIQSQLANCNTCGLISFNFFVLTFLGN